MRKTDLYQKQINYIFNRPDSIPEWYLSPHWEEGVFDGSPMQAFVLIETLLQDIKNDLSPYSNNQVASGLEFIFNNSLSNIASGFKKAKVPFKRKEAAIHALFTLFSDIFNPLCETKTSSNSQVHFSKLNNICYMFWDECPLSIWLQFNNTEEIGFAFMAVLSDADFENLGLPADTLKFIKEQGKMAKSSAKKAEDVFADVHEQYQNLDSETEGFYRAIARVMEQCLYLPNPACVESGLHGLGHLAFFLPNIAVPIIDNFLKKAKNQPETILDYAMSARTGMIL